jgi:hypothetical protein
MDVTNWRKASYSTGNGGNCVAVGNSPSEVHIMDTKDPEGPKLAMPASAWASLTRRLKKD